VIQAGQAEYMRESDRQFSFDQKAFVENGEFQ
jgi:hypothetical protein